MRPALALALLAALAAAPRPARAAAAATAASLSDCLRALGAEVVEPAGGAAFAATRQVNNARISAWPIAVAYPADAAQVAALVRCCAAAGVCAVPRGGGHSYEGLSVQSGAVIVDVSRIDYMEVDAQRRTARVGGGATLGKVYAAVAAASPTLAAVGGVCPSVGVGGHILGGGWGLMARAFGQACDLEERGRAPRGRRRAQRGAPLGELRLRRRRLWRRRRVHARARRGPARGHALQRHRARRRPRRRLPRRLAALAGRRRRAGHDDRARARRRRDAARPLPRRRGGARGAPRRAGRAGRERRV
jgi:hypothetical protein